MQRQRQDTLSYLFVSRFLQDVMAVFKHTDVDDAIQLGGKVLQCTSSATSMMPMSCCCATNSSIVLALELLD
jgi:hypothetical protein